jgi:LuxR family transcriptional regulator, maltose regulon positive regulatory protein
MTRSTRPASQPPLSPAGPFRRVEAADALARIKLFPPRTNAKILVRHRLLEDVAKKDVKLIIVRAPAGFGKTTVLQQWREAKLGADVRCGWLTLDQGDNDPTKLISGLGNTIHAALDDGAEQFENADNDVAFPNGSIDRLSRLQSPFALFLDDVDALEGAAARSVLQSLLRSTPDHVQVIVAGRSIPSLGQARLRLADAVLDIGEDELRFHRDEIGHFFVGRGHALSRPQLDELARYTDGWAAALQLAALSMRHCGSVRTIRDAIGMESGVAEYLQEDVLEREPAHVRRFLLDVSVLRLLNGTLCDALTGRKDGDAMLSLLEDEGLFLKRVGINEGIVWYRFQPLFADFLRRELATEGAGPVAMRHLAASSWFASQGMTVEAAEHAKAGGNTEHALELLDSVAMDHIQRGELTTVLSWGRDLSVEVAHRYERLFAAYIWAEGFVGDTFKAQRRFQDLLELASSLEKRPAFLAMTIICLPVMLAGARQDLETMCREGPQALSQLQPGTFEHGAVACCVAYALLASGDRERAADALFRAKASCQQAGRCYGLAHTYMIESIMQICDLRLNKALAGLRTGYERITAEFSALSQSSGTIASYYAESLYEAGRLDLAASILEKHLNTIAGAIPDCTITGYRASARMATARGDMAQAGEIVHELRSLGLSRQSTDILRAADWEACWLDALAGATAEATKRYAELVEIDAELDPHFLSPADGLVRDLYRLRIALTLDLQDWSIDEISGLIAGSERRGLGIRRLRLQMLKAVALDQSGRAAEARIQMHDAIIEVTRSGFQRMLLDEGPVVIRLAREVMRGSDIDAAEYPAFLSTADEIHPSQSEMPASAKEGKLLQRLTERENDILLVLEKGLTNREIAECMNVSESTVKWHLRNIFDKLGVGNRTEAASLLRNGC